ncbi:RCC1 domain-containing protein [Acidovorax sp. LjRoot66]|uniref:RCC1 domain-containing protein n=1 Tax=Acidovorax sp. LjRoot66 TaxID=3342334 RepID=UPI003F504103
MFYRRLVSILGCILFSAAGASASATGVSVGESHSCAVTSAGAAKCWGANSKGQLGDGTVQPSMTPVAVAGLAKGVKDVKVGKDFSCALLDDKSVRCWGSIVASQGEVAISGVVDSSQIAAGPTHACAVSTNGEAYCWGDASKGQMGGVSSSTLTTGKAVNVPELSGAVKIATGKDATCAALKSGKTVCIGAASNLEGSIANPMQPLQLPNINDSVDVAINEGHACVLRASGTVACWGQNQFGQLGVPATSIISPTAVEVATLPPARSVSVGKGFSCAMLMDGKIQCWGANEVGQLGNGNEAVRSKTVIGITNAAFVSSGARHSCAVIEIGSYIQCWGSNESGLLGTGLCYTQSAFYQGYTGRPYLTNSLGLCVNDKALTPYSVKGFDVRANADKVMIWAERSIPTIFGMGEGITHEVQVGGYFWRRYVGGHNLAVTAHGTPRLMYLGPESNNQLLDLGELSMWSSLAN